MSDEPVRRPKGILLSVLFYGIYIAVVCILSDSSPDGPCNPGLGTLALLVLPVISLILLFVNIAMKTPGKSRKPQVLLHLLVFLVCMGMFFLS